MKQKHTTIQEVKNEDKHTAGPWELQGPKTQEAMDGQTYWAIKPDPYKSKADHYKPIGFYYPYSGLTPEEQQANADLIAAAPQLKSDNKVLLNCIKELVNEFEVFEDIPKNYKKLEGWPGDENPRSLAMKKAIQLIFKHDKTSQK